MLADRNRIAWEDRRRIEEGDHAGGIHSSQSEPTDGRWALSRFQTQFTDLVKHNTGADVFRSAIIGALVGMKVHHEAMTGTNEMMAAMETVESARAVFGIGPTRVLQAITNIVHSIQTCRREWQAQNPRGDREWTMESRFMSMFQDRKAGGGPGPDVATSRGPREGAGMSGGGTAATRAAPEGLCALGATSSTGSSASLGPAAVGAQDPEGKLNIDARSLMSYISLRSGSKV